MKREWKNCFKTSKKSYAMECHELCTKPHSQQKDSWWNKENKVSLDDKNAYENDCCQK